MVRKASAAAVVLVAVVAVGASLAAFVSVRDSVGDGGTGYSYDPLTTAAAEINGGVQGVPLPAERPPGLNLLATPAQDDDRVEVLFQVGTQDVMLCQAADIADSSCIDAVTLIREAVTDAGQTWQVVLLHDDVQNGTGDPTDVIAWFEQVEYESSTPEWLVDLAAQAD